MAPRQGSPGPRQACPPPQASTEKGPHLGDPGDGGLSRRLRAFSLRYPDEMGERGEARGAPPPRGALTPARTQGPRVLPAPRRDSTLKRQSTYQMQYVCVRPFEDLKRAKVAPVLCKVA